MSGLGTWQILSGEAYEVRANSEDEALEIYFKWLDGELTEEEEKLHGVQHLEALTEASPIDVF
jgi:hypothetical protein